MQGNLRYETINRAQWVLSAVLKSASRLKPAKGNPKNVQDNEIVPSEVKSFLTSITQKFFICKYENSKRIKQRYYFCVLRHLYSRNRLASVYRVSA